MEIKIGKKQYLWAYTAYFFKLGSFFFVAPIVWAYLPKAHVDIWFLFTTITMGIGLLDFGFTPSMARAITNAFSGAKEILPEGVSQESTEDGPNYLLLLSLFRASKKVYAIIAAAALALLATGGTFYLWCLCENQNLNSQGTTPDSGYFSFPELLPVWALFVVSCVLAIYFRYLDVFMAGRGSIALANKIGILFGVLTIALTFLILYFGGGLLGTICLSIVLSLASRVVIVRFFFDAELKKNLKAAERIPEKPVVLPAIWYNAKKSGINSVGVFLIYQATALIGGYYFPNDFTKIVITLRVFNFLNTFSSSYFTLSYVRYVSLLVNKKMEQLRWEFLRALFISVIIMIVGSAAVLWKGNTLLHLVGHGKVLLPGTAVLLLYVAVFLTEAIHGKCATLITVKNVIPFIPTTFLTGIATISLSMIFILVFDLGILSFPLATLLAQLAYNSWRWPLWVIRDFEFSPRDFRNVVKFSCLSVKNNIRRYLIERQRV